MSRFGFGEPADAYPLTDRAEVEECRRFDVPFGFGLYLKAFGYDILGPLPDDYDTAAELGAARDLEFWGCNPFEED